MYNAFRNGRRALFASKRTNTDRENKAKEVPLPPRILTDRPTRGIIREAREIARERGEIVREPREKRPSTLSCQTGVTTLNTDQVTHLCANCGEGFSQEIDWKEHSERCADDKKAHEHFPCPQEKCEFLAFTEDDVMTHTRHAHEDDFQLATADLDTNDLAFESSGDTFQNNAIPFHCKPKAEGNTEGRSENLPIDAELDEDRTKNSPIVSKEDTECILHLNGHEVSKGSVSQLPSTRGSVSSQHGSFQQTRLEWSQDQLDFLLSLEDDPMYNELIEPIVTDFFRKMLNEVMSSFDIGTRRTFEICVEDEFDSDSDGLDVYEGDAEEFPPNGGRNVASSIFNQPRSPSTDEDSIRSSNTPSDLSIRVKSSSPGSSSRTSSSGGAKEGKGSSRAYCEGRKKRTRRASSYNVESDLEDGKGSDEDEKEHVERRKPSETCTNGKKLACPFYQRRPQSHPKSTACIHPGFKTIARLKEHLYRQHYRISCLRCGQSFEKDDELKVHLKAKVACESTDEEPSEEYMTTRQRDQLRTKKRKAGQDTPERKWEGIYQLLFPEDTPPLPSPYCEPTAPRPTSPSSPHLAGFQDFCFQRLRSLVMVKLQSDLRTLEPVVQARLKDSMDEILREAPAQIRRQWEEQNHVLASQSSQGTNEAEFNASKSASSDQAVINAAITQAQPTEPGQIEQPAVNAPTAEGGTQGSISIPDLNEYFNDLAEYHNEQPDISSSEGLNKPLMDHATIAAVDTNLDFEQQTQVIPQISEEPFLPLDATLLMDWNDSFFESLNFGTDTAVTDTSASQLPGRRSDSLLEPLLQKRPDKDGYPQNGSFFHFEGPGTMANAEIDELTSDLWDLDSSTAQHTADRHDLCPISLGEAEGCDTSDCNGNVEQSDLSMIGFLNEHKDGSFLPPLCPQPNPNVSGPNES